MGDVLWWAASICAGCWPATLSSEGVLIGSDAAALLCASQSWVFSLLREQRDPVGSGSGQGLGLPGL